MLFFVMESPVEGATSTGSEAGSEGLGKSTNFRFEPGVCGIQILFSSNSYCDISDYVNNMNVANQD